MEVMTAREMLRLRSKRRIRGQGLETLININIVKTEIAMLT